jgi:hypothetical protein
MSIEIPISVGPFDLIAGHFVQHDDGSGELWLFPIQVLPNPPADLKGSQMFEGGEFDEFYRPRLEELGITYRNVVMDLNHPLLNELLAAYETPKLKVKDLTAEELQKWLNYEEPSVLLRDLPDSYMGWAILEQCEN